jgi:hypothetical protein
MILVVKEPNCVTLKGALSQAGSAAPNFAIAQKCAVTDEGEVSESFVLQKTDRTGQVVCRFVYSVGTARRLLLRTMECDME